jgi:hypothetical protein
MSSDGASEDDLDLGDDLSISSPARGQALGGSPAVPPGLVPSSSSSQEPPPPAQGPSREARAAAALARLASIDDKGRIDQDALKARCLLEKQRDWQRFIERSLVGPNTYLQVRRHDHAPAAARLRASS